MKLKKLFDNWLEQDVKNTLKIKTYFTYYNIANKHIVPILGEYNLNNLNKNIIQNFITQKLKEGSLKNKGGLSTNTIRSIYSVLKLAIKYAIEFDLIDKNIASNIKLPQKKEKEINAFTVKEREKIINYCINHKKENYFGIVLCLYTGIRIGELLALTWEDIDFNRHLLHINKTVSKVKIDDKNKLHIDSPKTKASNRVIPIPKPLIPILKRIKENQNRSILLLQKPMEWLIIDHIKEHIQEY